MEPGPSSDADNPSASEEIPQLSRNPKIHYYVHNSDAHPVHSPYLKSIFYYPALYTQVFQLVSSIQTAWPECTNLFSPMRATSSAYFILLDLITLIELSMIY